jgi:hypothetical protein
MEKTWPAYQHPTSKSLVISIKPFSDATGANREPSPRSEGRRSLRLNVRKPEILQLYISPGHNFFGHHGREPDKFPAIEVPTLECVTGRGIRGDRFFDYKGQITFFAREVFEHKN